MTPAPDAGREPSAQAVEAARLAVDETAQCDCEMTDGASCFFRLDLPGQKAMCLKSALRAAYAVDFPTDDEIAAIVRGRALPASQPGELTDAAQRERLATLIDSFFRESWLYEVPSDAVQRLADRLLATGLFATGASFSSADNRALLAEVNSYVIHGKDCAWHWPKPPAFERPACNCIKARIARALSPAPKEGT